MSDVIKIKYAQLKELKDSGYLQVGTYYEITDFQTMFNDTSGNLVSANAFTTKNFTETLTINALSENTLSKYAQSSQFPTDIIHYNIDVGERGMITYRECTIKHVSCDYDFRGRMFPLWLCESQSRNAANKINIPSKRVLGSKSSRGINNDIGLDFKNSTALWSFTFQLNANREFSKDYADLKVRGNKIIFHDSAHSSEVTGSNVVFTDHVQYVTLTDVQDSFFFGIQCHIDCRGKMQNCLFMESTFVIVGSNGIRNCVFGEKTENLTLCGSDLSNLSFIRLVDGMGFINKLYQTKTVSDFKQPYTEDYVISDLGKLHSSHISIPKSFRYVGEWTIIPQTSDYKLEGIVNAESLDWMDYTFRNTGGIFEFQEVEVQPQAKLVYSPLTESWEINQPEYDTEVEETLALLSEIGVAQNQHIYVHEEYAGSMDALGVDSNLQVHEDINGLYEAAISYKRVNGDTYFVVNTYSPAEESLGSIVHKNINGVDELMSLVMSVANVSNPRQREIQLKSLLQNNGYTFITHRLN